LFDRLNRRAFSQPDAPTCDFAVDVGAKEAINKPLKSTCTGSPGKLIIYPREKFGILERLARFSFIVPWLAR
jgi:hypothetical protein